jgi:hypothetical protein
MATGWQQMALAHRSHLSTLSITISVRSSSDPALHSAAPTAKEMHKLQQIGLHSNRKGLWMDES